MIAIEMLLVAAFAAQAQPASPQPNAAQAPQSHAPQSRAPQSSAPQLSAPQSNATQSLARPPQAAPNAPAPQSTGPKPVAPHPRSPTLGSPSAAPAQSQDASSPAAPDVEPRVEPYGGSLAEGLAKMESLCDTKDHDDALAIGQSLLAPTRILRWREEKLAEPGFLSRVVRASDPLFGFFGLEEHSPEERAAVCYAMGVVASRAEKPEDAVRSFERARELAGAGLVRLDATYNLGVIALEAGEAERQKIPELNPNAAQPPQAPPMPAGAAPNASGASGPPDPLELAKAAYLRARTELLQRLKLDWKDADTRANIELVQRRLDELDRIQRQREEQKKQQEQQDKDKDQQNKDQKNQDPKDKGQDSKDSKNDDKQKDQQKPDEKPPEDKPKENEKPEDQKPQDQSKEDKPEDQGAAPKEEPSERLLTKEEMTRLFDLLQQAESQGKKIERELRQMRRAKVKKDW